MNPTLNESFELQHFEHGKAVELHNGIMIDLYNAPDQRNACACLNYHIIAIYRYTRELAVSI